MAGKAKMSHYHKGYRGRSVMEQSRYFAYSPGRRLFASDLEALQLLSMKYNVATAEWKTRLDKNLSDRQIKNGDNCTVSISSLADVNSNNLELSSRMKLENISVIETSTCRQKAPRIDVQEEKRISDVKLFWKSNRAKQHGQMGTQSQELENRCFSDNVRAYLSGVRDISSEHHFPTCSKSMETKTEGLKLDLAKSAVSKQESSSSTQTQVLEANSSLENIVSQSCTGTAASDSVTSSSFVTQGQNHSILASDTAHHPSYMGLASQFHGDVMIDSHGAVSNPSIKVFKSESKSTNSFQISVPREKISGRVKKDQQRNKEPVCFISSEGKKPTNQGAVLRQLTQNTGTRSGLSVSCTASIQNSLEPVHFTFGRETCENKVCLSNTTILKNNEEIRPREPKNHFHSGNIVLTIPKFNVKSVGQMQQERTKSKKRWNNLVNSGVAKPVKISTRDPRRHGRLFANNFVQRFSGLGSVLQQSDCRVGNQSHDIEDCSGKIETDKVKKEHLTKFSGFNDSNSLNQQSTSEKSSFQENNFNYITDRTTAGNTIKTTYFENCNKSSAQSVSSVVNPIRRNASAMLPSNNFHVTDIQSIVNISERCVEMPPTSISAISDWQLVPAVSKLPVDRTPTHGLMEEEAKLIDSDIAQDQEKFLNVDRYSVADAFITNEDPENYKCLSDVLQSKNSTQNSGCKDGIPHKNTFMNDHRNFSSGKMDQAMFIVKGHDYPADKDMGQSHRSGLLEKFQTDSAKICHAICTMVQREQTEVSDFFDEKQIIDQGKQDECEKLENKLPSICASHIQPKTKDMPLKVDPDIKTIYKSLPAVATLKKSLESNVLAVPVIKSITEVNMHALPSAWMFIDTNSKLAPPIDSLKREPVLVTIMYNTCRRSASVMSTTTENNVPHKDRSVNDDLRSVICVDPIMCGCKAVTPVMNSSDKNDKVVTSIKISRENDVSSCENSNEQNTQPMPSVDNSHEQITQPMPSCDNSNEQITQPMPSVDNSNEQNTQPMPSRDNSHEQNAQPMPSCDNSHEQITQPVPSVDNSHKQNAQPVPSFYNSHEQNAQPVPSVDNSYEQNAQPMPSCDNSQEQISQPVPSYDNSSVIDAHALPTVDKSCDHIEQVPLFLGNSETSQGHKKMETFHSLNKDNEDSLSKSLQSWCMNTVLNIQPVQPCCSDFSYTEMQNSSKSGSEHAAVDYGDIYDLDVSGNLQPYSLEQNSPEPEKSIPLFPAHALSLDDEDRFGLDEIMYHPTADLVWEGDAAHNFQRQSDPSKKNHEDIRGNILASSTKDIKLINEDKGETLGMTQLCGGSTFNNSERSIRNLSQPPEFAGLVENDTILEIQTVSKEIMLDKVNNLSHNCMTEINKDNKNSEKRVGSDADLIRDILSQEDQIHEEGNYSLIEKIPIETENRHATQTYGNCSLCNEKQSSTKTSSRSAEKGSKKSISHTRQNVRITDVLLLEAKKFIQSDILTGNRSGLNRTRLETSRTRSSRLLLKQLKATPRKAKRKIIQKIKQPCVSKRKGTRRKGEERQLNNDHGSDLVKETCEKAAKATEENKENRESSIITDFSVKTYPCKDIRSQTEQLLPQIRIPENMHLYQKTGLEKEDRDKKKYGAQRRNRLAKLTEDACNAETGESSYCSQSSSIFKHCSKSDKTDANINLTIKASRENQMEQIPNLEGRKEALSLVAKLKERIEKPNQVCPFDDDINLRDYVSEVRIEKQDADMVSDKFFRKKRHLGVDESSKSKRSRWYFKADGPEQLKFRIERKRHIRKNVKRKLKRHHNDEDSEMAITCLKTASGERKFKSNVSEHNEKTRGTPYKQTMKKIRTKLVFSREEFEKSKKERRLKRCVYCGEMNREVLHMIHIKKYHPHHCAQCQKDFQSKKFKWEHYLQTHVQQTYPCGPCDRKFISKSFFERHLASAAHRHRISDILFQQVKKKSSRSKDTMGLLTEAKMSSEMDVSSDLGSICDAASIAEIVQQQSLILSLIQDQMMLGSGVDVTNLVVEQNNVNNQQPSSLLNSNHAGVRVFSDTNIAMGNAYQHHTTSQSSPDLNIPYLNDTVNSDHAFVLRNDASTHTQIGAGHGSAKLSTVICTSNYKSCPGNDSGEHGSTGQELMHFHYETSHSGQGPINMSSDLNNPQSSPMAPAGWLSTAINVMADDSISHDTEYNLWPDQSLPNISTKNTFSNLQGVSLAPHQLENDCLNFNQATHQSGRACLDSIEAANQLGKDSLDSILAAQQSRCILDCKKSCINRTISKNTESMNTFNSPSCSTGNEARSSFPKSVANTHSPDFGPFQCFYTSSNKQIMEQHAVAFNLNADNNESVDRSCEPTKSAISNEGGYNPKALMELDPCVTLTAPIYENCLSNGYHGISLVASISETPQSIQNPSPNYRVPSEENGVNNESEGRLREQLNQILFDIELSEQQAQQY